MHPLVNLKAGVSKYNLPVKSEKIVASEIGQRGWQVVDVPQGQVGSTQVDGEVPSALKLNWTR